MGIHKAPQREVAEPCVGDLKNDRDKRVLKSEYCKNDDVSKSFVTFSPIFHSLGRYVPI